MSPYLLTITFLTLMSLLTSTAVMQFQEESLTSQIHERALIQQADIERERQEALYQDCQPPPQEEKKTPPPEEHPTSNSSSNELKFPALNYSFERPPNNGRYNIYLLMYPEQLPNAWTRTKQHTDYYEKVGVHLLENLYGRESFFQEVPRAASRLMEALKEKKEEATDYLFPDELSALSFKDPELQAIFYKMLKGSQSYPSLLSYITFDKELGQSQKRNLNFLFASPELLLAFFDQNRRVVDALLKFREEFWQKVKAEEETRGGKGRETLRQELKEAYEKVLTQGGLDPRFYGGMMDYSLGEKGTIILSQDPLTGVTKREKYFRKSRKMSPPAPLS